MTDPVPLTTWKAARLAANAPPDTTAETNFKLEGVLR